jgi:hypothetical protein
MSNLNNLIIGEAELDDEEDDASFDSETGEALERQRKNGDVDDSSEEDEDDDDDEEEVRRVRWPLRHCCLQPASSETDPNFRSEKASSLTRTTRTKTKA